MTVNVYDYCIKDVHVQGKIPQPIGSLCRERNTIEPNRKKREDKVETKICSGH